MCAQKNQFISHFKVLLSFFQKSLCDFMQVYFDGLRFLYDS